MEIGERYKQFCLHYLVDMNATQAAIRAGYKPENAKVQGSRLIAKPEIQQYLSTLYGSKHKQINANLDNVISKFKNIIHLYEQLTELALKTNHTPDEAQRYKQLKALVTTRDYIRATEHLAKITGLYDRDYIEKVKERESSENQLYDYKRLTKHQLLILRFMYAKAYKQEDLLTEQREWLLDKVDKYVTEKWSFECWKEMQADLKAKKAKEEQQGKDPP